MITAIIAYIIGFVVAYLLYWHKTMLYIKEDEYLKVLRKVAIWFGLFSWVSVVLFLIDEIIELFTSIKK